MSRTLLMQFFAGIALTILHRKPGNLQGSSCSHCQGTPCSTQLMCGSLQQEKQVMPRCAQDLAQNCQLTVRITIIAVNYGYCYPHKLPSLPRPDEHPSCRAVSRELHTKLPICPNPVNNTRQNPRQHSVQQNGLKQKWNKNPEFTTISPYAIRRHYGTNQNLIARPGNSHIDLAGRQHKALPQFFYQLVAPTQLQSIDQARDFGQQWQLRIHVSGCIRNQILPKRIFTVPDYKGRKHNSVPLSLKLVFRERVPVKI